MKETSKEESDGAMLTSCSSISSRQLSIQESTDRTRVWATNDAKALRVSRKIGEMIAIDCQPLSIVSDREFVHLLKTLEPRYQIPSRKYITDMVIPDIESDVRARVKEDMKDVRCFSFTSDIWSTEVSNDSLLSLSAHWLTQSFERRYAMLHAQL